MAEGDACQLVMDALAAGYDGRPVISSMTWSCRTGVYALVGSNGSGKSTLLKTLAGVLPPLAGRIRINGSDLHRSGEHARRQLAYLPTEPVAFPFVTGEDFLRLIAAAKQVAIGASLLDVCAQLHLQEVLPLTFSEMSTGMRKKLFLAAMTIGDPTVILLDEPSNALDAQAREVLIHLLSCRRTTAAILCATHDQDLIMRLQATTINLPWPHPK